MHVKLGGYHVSDIEFSAAFDVNARKVGRDLSEAIFAEPNNTYKFASVPKLDVPVRRGPTMDGLGRYSATSLPNPPTPPPTSCAC
jgi:myo-inositol-1-phosphate synthase